MNQGDITGGVGLSENILVLGHGVYAKMSVWKWNSNFYEKLQRKNMLHGGPYAEYSTAILRKDRFSSLPNEIYGVFGSTCLFKVTLNGKDIS